MINLKNNIFDIMEMRCENPKSIISISLIGGQNIFFESYMSPSSIAKLWNKCKHKNFTTINTNGGIVYIDAKSVSSIIIEPK